MGKQVIVVGAGIAAINAIKAIREFDREVALNLFSAEPVAPYNRMRLSKGLFAARDEASNLLQQKDWYDQHRVTLHLGEAVATVDEREQTVTLRSGRKYGYDQLLLANGARNRAPAIEGLANEKVATLRNLADAQMIRQRLAKTHTNTNTNTILNIGGGIQGLETAWSLTQQRQKAIIAELQPRLMPLQLDEAASRIVKAAVEAAGVEVLTGTQIERIGDDADGFYAVTQTGERIGCDLLLYATGIKSNTGIVQGTAIRVNQGIVVDERMRTSVANVYAAGDVAEYQGRVYGLWNIAVEQGKTAGHNIVNQPAAYRTIVPVTTLNGYGLSLFSMGNVAETLAEATLIEADLERRVYRRIFVRDHRIVGAIMIGDTNKSPVLKTAIEQQLPLENIPWSEITVAELMEYLKNLKKQPFAIH